MAEPEQRYLKGYLLLDSGQLRGSFFQRTVVLICQHDSEGAFGLVLNKPAGTIVGEILLSDVPEPVKTLPLFSGGPVQPGALSYLHTAESDEGLVIPGVSLSHSLELLGELPEEPDLSSKLKLFAGYSGWSGGQLEDEMARDAWLTFPATPELIFDPNPAQLWQKVLKLKGWKYRILAQMPEDPEWN
jgi:putative transcriptional regulator